MSDEARTAAIAAIGGTDDDPNALRGRRVLVMGLGLLGGGVGAVKYAVHQGASEVVATDLRDAATLAPSLRKLDGLPVRFVLGRHEMADFEAADVVVRNPGVRRSSPYLQAATAAGKRVEQEVAWFFRACRGRIAGVTGTRGKSTVTTLLHHILREAELQPLLGGNLGGIETLSLLPKLTPDRWVVLELGNWMLEGLHPVRLSPNLAIFTNLLDDHMNAYDSMADYGEAKSAIFRYQGRDDIALFDAENEWTVRYAAEAPAGHVWLYDTTRGVSYPRGNSSALRPFVYGAESRLRGAHNLGNVQAATLAAELLGVEPATISAAVRTFAGIPHRLESVRTLGGVQYINDSASTAPIAGSAALRAFDEPLVLIAGGNSKDLDASAFAAEVAGRVKRLVLLQGNATEQFAAQVRAAAEAQGRPDPGVGPFDSLAAALAAAREVAVPGDVVLLSPAFTSFGLFLHEFDRGDQFRALVQALPEEG